MDLINFKTHDGVELNGFLYKNSIADSKKIILSVHGMSSNCFSHREQTIAKIANENGMDYYCFNNRGAELTKYIKKAINGKSQIVLGGTSHEEILESHFDIIGAMRILISLGYTDIYLQGHSLGATKIVYTYGKLKDEQSKLLESIKGIMLLSLIDIKSTLTYYLGEKYTDVVKLAKKKVETGDTSLMPKDSFIHPISAQGFLRYSQDNKEIECGNYSKGTDFDLINKIDTPLFMRWGTVNELCLLQPDELMAVINKCITVSNKNIGCIYGASHNYTKKELELAKEIINFIK